MRGCRKVLRFSSFVVTSAGMDSSREGGNPGNLRCNGQAASVYILGEILASKRNGTLLG
jgi:hypothetical protein